MKYRSFRSHFTIFYIIFLCCKAKAQTPNSHAEISESSPGASTLSNNSTYPCFVVSGLAREHEFIPYPESRPYERYHKKLLAEGKIAGRARCETVKSWSELESKITTWPHDTLPKQILVLQGAHGIKNGVSKCDSGDVPPEQILRSLERISAVTHTAAILDTCFSTEILKRQLQHEQSSAAEEKLDQLCIVYGGLFGLVSISTNTTPSLMDDPATFSPRHDLLTTLEEKMGSAQDLETLFRDTNTPNLISSGAWNTVGIGSQLSHPDYKLFPQTLQNINQIARQSDQKNRFSLIMGSLVQLPYLNVEQYQTIKSIIENEQAMPWHKIEDMPLKKNIFFSDETPLHACKEFLETEIKKQRPSSYADLWRFNRSLQSQPEFSICQKNLHIQEAWELFVAPAQQYLKAYEKGYQELTRLTGKTWSNLSGDLFANELDAWTQSKQAPPNMNPEVAALIYKEIFSPSQTSLWGIDLYQGTVRDLIYQFSRGGTLVNSTELTSKNDVLRRNACRNFKL